MKIPSKFTFFRVLTLSGFILSGAFPTSLLYAQDNAGKIEVNSECDFALSEGTRYNENNHFFKTIKLLERDCPPDLEDDEETKQAYELIALAYIGAEYPERARKYVNLIREIDPLYVPGNTHLSIYIDMYPPTEAGMVIDSLQNEKEQLEIVKEAAIETAKNLGVRKMTAWACKIKSSRNKRIETMGS